MFRAINWTTFKAFLEKNGPPAFYLSRPNGETYDYLLYTGNSVFRFSTICDTPTNRTDFVDNYKDSAFEVASEDDAFARMLSPVNQLGAQQVELTPRVGRVGHTSWTIVSHHWGDKTTWAQNSSYVENHSLTGNEARTEYQADSNKRYWINAYNPRSTRQAYNEAGVMNSVWQKDATLLPKSHYMPIIKVNGDPVDPVDGNGDLVWSIDYAEGKVYFEEALAEGSAVTATFHYAGDSRFILRPPDNKVWIVTKVEIQKTAGTDFKLKDTSLFQIWADPTYTYSDPVCMGYEMDYQSIQNLDDTSRGAITICPATGGTDPYLPCARNGYGRGYIRGVEHDREIIRWEFDEAPFYLCSRMNMSLIICQESNIPHEAECCSYTLWVEEDNRPDLYAVCPT